MQLSRDPSFMVPNEATIIKCAHKRNFENKNILVLAKKAHTPFIFH
jgi:hypothetical protein